MGNKTTEDTTEENTMDEQKELEELKLKASALEEKLAKKAELSSANADAGVKKIALEYKIVEQFIPMSLNGVREFEETKLKELGEEGWTLRSIAREGTAHVGAGYTNLYYFSRPL